MESENSRQYPAPDAPSPRLPKKGWAIDYDALDEQFGGGGYPGLGSAIFLHVARPDYSASEGCVTLRQADLLNVLRGADKNSSVDVLKS